MISPSLWDKWCILKLFVFSTNKTQRRRLDKLTGHTPKGREEKAGVAWKEEEKHAAPYANASTRKKACTHPSFFWSWRG